MILKLRFFIILTSIFLITCVSNDKVSDSLSLDTVIDNSVQKIVRLLPKGTRVAIVKFDSYSTKISDYIWEELSYRLVNSGMTVADRTNLPYIYKELNFQISGDVDDDTAQSIGKFIGAQSIITGDLVDIGKAYRLRINATNVEKAVREVSDRQDVLKTKEINGLFIALDKNELVSKTASYGVDDPYDSKDAGALLDKGISFASEGYYDEAIRVYTESLKINPNLSAAYFNRGNAYALKGQLNLSINDYNQAIKIDKTFLSAYRSRGLTYFRLYDYDKAINDYTIVINLNKSESYLIYAARGKAYDRKQEYTKAIDDYTIAIKMKPNDVILHNVRGTSYYRINEYNKALSDFRKSLEIDPNDYEAQSYIEAILLELKYKN